MSDVRDREIPRDINLYDPDEDRSSDQSLSVQNNQPPPRPRVVHEHERPAQTLAVERVVVRHSDEIAELFAAMAEAQSEDGYGDVEKSKTARITSRKEGARSYEYKYETLADVIAATRPFLAKHGLSTFQFPFPGERSVTIRTMIGHKSGQWLYNDLSALIPMPDPQAVGSGISYLRRYALKSILNVAAEDEDDDGHRASARYEDEDDRDPRRGEPARQAPQPARRRSQTQAAAEQASAATQAAAATPESVTMVGDITEIVQRADGVVVFRIDGGHPVAAKTEELARAVRTYHSTKAHVSAKVRPAADRSKMADTLVAIIPVTRT